MNEVLERNLERLLREAYVPVQPRLPFVEHLRAELLARTSPRRPAVHRRAPAPRGRPALRLTAAVLAVLAGALAFRAATRPGEPAPSDLPQRLAAGEAASPEVPGPAAAASGAPTRDEEGFTVGSWSGSTPPVAAAGSARTRIDPAESEQPAASVDSGRAAGNEASTGAEARLAGTVRDQVSGEPVASFRVWYRREVELPRVSRPQSRAFEDPAGSFALAGLPPGRYAVFVEAADRATWSRRDVELGPQGRELEVALEPGGVVSGFVVDRETGAPLEGALVVAERDLPVLLLPTLGIDVDPLPRALARTDAVGAFELRDVSAGVHVLRASHPERAPSWASGVAVPAGGRVELAPLELGSGGALAGRVERADGSPAPGVPIVAALATMDGERPCLTFGHAEVDALGRYTIEHLPAGHYAVLNLAEHSDSRPDWKRVLQATVRSGETSELDFLGDRSAARAARVSGTLRGPDGAPLALRTLTLDPDDSDDGPQWVATSTRSDGSYEFQNVRPGRYGLYLTSESFADLVLVGELEVGDEADVLADLDLPPTELRVGVSRADDLRVQPPFVAILERDAGARWSFAGKLVAEHGQPIDVRGLPEGTYRVSAFPTDAGLGFVVSEARALRAGEPLELALALPPGGAIEILVAAPDGRPLERATVEILDATGRSVGYTSDPRTDSDGRQRANGLSVGAWRVRASREGCAAAAREVEVRAGETTRVELVLGPVAPR